MKTQEQNRSVILEVVLDTEDIENAYLAAGGIIDTLEQLEAVDYVRVLNGIADSAYERIGNLTNEALGTLERHVGSP